MDKKITYLNELDVIYADALKGHENVLERIDKFLIELPIYDDLSLFEIYKEEEIEEFFQNISTKISEIYKLIDLKIENITIEELREDFFIIEKMRFEIVNKYIMGIVKIDDIEKFKTDLYDFRHKLYAISISDSNILEIAKMKSKAQHFYTEVLEDEDVLRVAYSNSN